MSRGTGSVLGIRRTLPAARHDTYEDEGGPGHGRGRGRASSQSRLPDGEHSAAGFAGSLVERIEALEASIPQARLDGLVARASTLSPAAVLAMIAD
jgi:hypothetical protein